MRIEKELNRKSEAIENSLNGFDIIDSKGKFVYVNKAYVKMWGYDNAEEIIGTSPDGHCQDPGTPRRIIETLKASGKCVIEFAAKRKDGSLFDVLMYAWVVKDNDAYEIYPTTSIDISERKIAERELWESRERFKAVFNSSVLKRAYMPAARLN